MSPSDESAPERLRRDPIYRALFDVNTAIKLLIDPDGGRIVDANSAAVEFYGWPLAVLRTMRITEINQLTADEVRVEMDAARTLRRRYFRFRHRTASDEIRAVEVHSGPVEIDGRTLLLSIIHDVTEREQLEEHAHRGQRLEAIGQLAGGVAHDFNNLLTVVLSATRMLRGRLGADHPGLGFVDDIDGAAQRGADLTRQLLAFSRRQVMTARPVRLADVVEHLAPLLERSMGAAHTIALTGAPFPATTVIADPAQLEQVVMNLVLNARDAMAGGGVIAVRLATSAGDLARDVPASRWVTLAVRDHGVGMDEATRSRVFEPFFTTKRDGTGMGLATVYGIVVQSGGHVAVESAPARGTTFTVYLPATDEPAEAAPGSPPPPRAAAGRPLTILVVDDLEPVRVSIAGVLGDLGHRPVMAGGYDQAMAIARADLARIDLVLTDVVMPGRSGIALVHDLRALRPDLPCVIMSGDLRDQRGAELPARVVRLAKPFSIDQLEEVLAAALAPVTTRPGTPPAKLG